VESSLVLINGRNKVTANGIRALKALEPLIVIRNLQENLIKHISVTCSRSLNIGQTYVQYLPIIC
jgi:hypothetical protein